MFQSTTTYNEKEKIWQCAEDEGQTNANISIGQVIFEALEKQPLKICQICHDDGQIVTNEQTLLMSTRLAQSLEKAGLTHEHVVGIVAKSSVHVTHLLFACLFNATPFHTVSPLLEPAAIGALYAITRPKLIFCDGPNYELIKAQTISWAPKIFTITDHIENVAKIDDLLVASNTEEFYKPKQLVHGADQTMGIICSSGTTGRSKAISINNAQMMVTTAESDSSIIYTTASFDWISAIKTLLICTIGGSTRIVCSQPFSVELVVEIVRDHEVSACSLSHWHFSEVFRSPLATTENLSSLRAVLYGGGWISVATVQAAARTFESVVFVNVYGTSETDFIATCINPEKDNLVGQLHPGRTARIIDKNGALLGPNQVGELQIKTDQGWNGYYNNSAQSATMCDAEGWFHIGDLGYFDDEHNLYIVDRKKDLLRYKSMHYTPNEIEKVIMELPGVQEACVVGINDRIYGDAAGALIIRMPGSFLTENEVIGHVARRIPFEYKQLHAGVKFVEKMPLNLNGKLLRNVAREMFELKQMPKSSL